MVDTAVRPRRPALGFGLVIQRLRERKEWKLPGVRAQADRALAGAWWLVLVLRGVLPALFGIAMGVLVGAVQWGAGLAAPLTFAAVVFVLSTVENPRRDGAVRTARKEAGMARDVRERLAGAAEGRLQEVVRTALGEPGAALSGWDVAPVQGTASRPIYLVTGAARVGAAEHPWRMVLKVLAPVAGQDDPTDIFYWKRELLLYRSGLLDDLPADLRAPRCYGCDEPADGTVWLWLEHVREDGERPWPLARWALTARHLGQFNGAYLVGRPLLHAPWLGGRRLRTWLERHGQRVAMIAAAPGNPDVRRFWPQPVVDALLRLWEERNAFCAGLERLPQTFCHGDAIRRNLFARHGTDGSEETVGIDWEYAGQMAVGEEIGQTVSVASAFFDVEPADLPALDQALFTGYLAGLRDAGWRSDERQVRFAYAAHAALRNAFNAVGTTLPDEAQRARAQEIYGRTWEELAGARAAVRPFLLDRAQEARGLMETL